MDRQDIIDKINALGNAQPWNHSIELCPGVFTCSADQSSAGKNLIKWGRMKGFLESFSCKDKRILDIGCNDGFFSLKLAELGARVVALEANSKRIEKAKFVFNIRNVSKNVELINANIYDYPLDDLEYFDLVLCMGFIHRVKDPFTVLSMLTALSDLILLEFKAFSEHAYDRPYLLFDGKRSDPEDPFSTCYFIPSVRAVLKILRELGIEYYGIIGDPKSRRVIMLASKKKLSALEELNTLRSVNPFYLVSKFTKRFMKDVFKSLRGDFAED